MRFSRAINEEIIIYPFPFSDREKNARTGGNDDHLRDRDLSCCRCKATVQSSLNIDEPFVDMLDTQVFGKSPRDTPHTIDNANERT